MSGGEENSARNQRTLPSGHLAVTPSVDGFTSEFHRHGISESALRILNLFDDEDPEAVVGRNIDFTIDVIGALSFGGNLAPTGEDGESGGGDITALINATIDAMIPFNDDTEIWNATIKKNLTDQLEAFSAALARDIYTLIAE